MANDNSTIIGEIVNFIGKNGGSPSSWYVGVASDPKKRLGEHGVRETDTWIYREAESASSARAIETFFLERIKTDGGTGGGDASSRFVYAYKKLGHTNP